MSGTAYPLPDPIPGLGPEIRPEALDEGAVSLLAQGRPDLLHACLLLWHDRLDAAHVIVQRQEGERMADTLHAIMHRREPDEGNSCYWWARVGAHPLAADLGAEARRLGLGGLCGADGAIDPKAMTRACCRTSLPADALRALQACEIRLLASRLVAP